MLFFFLPDKPKFIDGPGEKVSVVEGEPAVVTVKAKANPDQIKYKWTRNNTPLKIKPKKLFFDGPILNFTEVGRKDKGKYECEASNGEGNTVYTLDLDVQCGLKLVFMRFYFILCCEILFYVICYLQINLR